MQKYGQQILYRQIFLLWSSSRKRQIRSLRIDGALKLSTFVRRCRERESKDELMSPCSTLKKQRVNTLEESMDSRCKENHGALIDSKSKPLKLTYEKVFYRNRKKGGIRIPNGQRELVHQRSKTSCNKKSGNSIYGFPGLCKMGRAQWCTGELKIGGFSKSTDARGADTNIVRYIGIAADEPERIRKNSKPGYLLPLVEIGWDEAFCRKWCEENDLLSPIYTTATRGGCWFCHNQSVGQLRLLRKNYPDLWALLMKWDADSPVAFHADGKTVHDFDRRFEAEDKGLIVAGDRKFRWKKLDELLDETCS